MATGAQASLESVPLQNTSSFFAKVMLFFGLALLISAAGAYVGFQYLSLFFLSTPLIWLFLAVELILVITARAWSKTFPLNYLLFAVFAFSSGLTIVPLLASVILEFGGPMLIIKALMATTLVFTASAVFGWVTKRNLSGLQGFLWVALIGMLVISVIGIFIPWSNNFELVFSGFGVVLFGGYTMYDIQQLKMYPSDRYIDGALRLYLDMFNLFIYILRLLSGLSRD